MTALACIASFFVGMAFMRYMNWLDRRDRPAVTPWGEPTAQWSEVNWAWYERRGGPPDRTDEIIRGAGLD